MECRAVTDMLLAECLLALRRAGKALAWLGLALARGLLLLARVDAWRKAR